MELRSGPLDPWRELAAYPARRPSLRGRAGATAVFVGSMREFNRGRAVTAMTLEHYPGMTEKHLERLCAEARERWTLLDVLLIHRVGEIRPEEPIVLVAAWSAHRADALSACRYLIDELKTRAPFWKQEQTGAGRRWVEPGG